MSDVCMMKLHGLISKYESKLLTLPALPISYIRVQCSDDLWANNLNKHSQQDSTLPFARSECYSVPIKSTRLLTHSSQDVKQVYEILFDIEDKEFNYNPGDTIGILPINSSDEVDLVIKTISPTDTCECERKILIDVIAGSKKKLPIFLPQQTSVRKCIQECLDLHGIPKKLFLRALIEYLLDDNEKRILAVLCSKEGAAEYSEWIVNARMVFLDILQMFQSWSQIPFHVLLEHLPRLLPRPYSIANSPLRNPNCLKIWFSLNEPPGITTKMLRSMIREGKSVEHPLLVPIYLRQSNAFSYTRNEMNDPVILVASGVGVSPFLGFLEHREEIQKLEKGVQIGNADLLYGCRHEHDSLCKDILTHHLQAGSLNDLKEAFSRDGSSEFKYVQDQIKSSETFVTALLKDNCRIFVCGSDGMVKDVRTAILNSLMDCLDYSNADASDFIQKIIKDKRYIEDTWI